MKDGLFMSVCNSQCFDGTQWGEQAFTDGLKLVVIEREQVEVLQVFKSVHTQTVDLVGVEKSARANKRFVTEQNKKHQFCLASQFHSSVNSCPEHTLLCKMQYQDGK